MERKAKVVCWQCGKETDDSVPALDTADDIETQVCRECAEKTLAVHIVLL